MKTRSAIAIQDDTVTIGRRVSVTFERTLRIPDDGKTYPLPPGLGAFPILRVDDYYDSVPESWRERGGVFIPMYQREAMWLSFGGWFGSKPAAVQVGVGDIDAITGRRLRRRLKRKRQNYLVVPQQPWLDGINAGDGFIRQFVAMPLGMGYTVEEQVSERDAIGGLQLVVYPPKPGAIDEVETGSRGIDHVCALASPGASMGLGAGGKMRQKIYPDPYGVDVWSQEEAISLHVHIANSMTYREITGHEPPPTPISAKLYARHNLPWFDLYDEQNGDVPGSDKLKRVKSVKEMDEDKGFGPQQDDSPVKVGKKQVVRLVRKVLRSRTL